jgi:hypothetical protein
MDLKSLLYGSFILFVELLMGQSAFPGGVSSWVWPFATFPPGFTHAVFGAADAVAISDDGAITSANALTIATAASVVVVVFM